MVTIPEIADLVFYDEITTVWDDTNVLGGYPGLYALIARRKGEALYVGALAGTEPHKLSLKLDFLDPDTDYKATIYSDDPSLSSLTNIAIQEKEVNRQSHLEETIQQQNGLAIILTPIHNGEQVPD